jgi:hypothetical protein
VAAVNPLEVAPGAQTRDVLVGGKECFKLAPERNFPTHELARKLAQLSVDGFGQLRHLIRATVCSSTRRGRKLASQRTSASARILASSRSHARCGSLASSSASSTPASRELAAQGAGRFRDQAEQHLCIRPVTAVRKLSREQLRLLETPSVIARHADRQGAHLFLSFGFGSAERTFAPSFEDEPLHLSHGPARRFFEPEIYLS